MFGVLYKYFPLHFQYLAESSISNKQFIFLIKKIFRETGFTVIRYSFFYLPLYPKITFFHFYISFLSNLPSHFASSLIKWESKQRSACTSAAFSALALTLKVFSRVSDWHVIFTLAKPLKVHSIFNFSLYFGSLISFFPHKILHSPQSMWFKNSGWKMIFFVMGTFQNLLVMILGQTLRNLITSSNVKVHWGPYSHYTGSCVSSFTSLIWSLPFSSNALFGKLTLLSIIQIRGNLYKMSTKIK